jgi:hypothetical protein
MNKLKNHLHKTSVEPSILSPDHSFRKNSLRYYLTISFLVLSIGLFLSCNPGNLTPEQYLDWIRENRDRITFQTSAGQYQYELTYLPQEWLTLQEIGDYRPSQTEWTEIFDSYAGTKYFQLRISVPEYREELLKNGIQSTAEYYQRVDYCSFGMQKDIGLITKTDTVPCHLFHFERTYGNTSYLSFVLGFEEERVDAPQCTFVFNDPVFSDQEIRIDIDQTVFEKTPQIKL